MANSVAKGSRREVWMRGLFMLIFIVLFWVGQWLLGLLALIQFFWLLFSGQPNSQLTSFGRSLANWLAQVGRFQCVGTEERPFPWATWPNSD